MNSRSQNKNLKMFRSHVKPWNKSHTTQLCQESMYEFPHTLMRQENTDALKFVSNND